MSDDEFIGWVEDTECDCCGKKTSCKRYHKKEGIVNYCRKCKK